MNVVCLLMLLGSCCYAYGAVLPLGSSPQARRVARQIDPNTLMMMMLFGGDDMDFEFFDDFEENPFLMQSLLSSLNPEMMNQFPGFPNFAGFPGFPGFPGFTGFPFFPGNVNECAHATTHSCSENSNCKDTTMGYECECVNGFEKNETKCQDVNECLLKDQCLPNAVCNNTEGSFTCTCLDGFVGDGKLFCSDIDECLIGKDTCTENFDCINVIGSHVCICKPGYITSSSGKACEDVNECATNNGNCSPNANCINTDGSFVCTCRDNFVGDGSVCVAFPPSA